jgi:hypothetical protein
MLPPQLKYQLDFMIEVLSQTYFPVGFAVVLVAKF